MNDPFLIRILLVEDSPTDALLLREALAEVPGAAFAITHVEKLGEALARLGQEEFDVVLLDLGLPDSQGPDTLSRLRKHQPGVPVVVLTGLDDEAVGIRAMLLGAQDYLVKGRFQTPLLARFLRYAIGRHHGALALRKSEARLSGLIDSAMDAIITVDETQRIILFNPAAEQTFGCKAGEVLGQTLDRFIPERFRSPHADHLRVFGQTNLARKKMGQPRLIYGLRADGTEFPIEASVSHVDVAGQKLFTIILRDITERMRAESAIHLRTKALEAAANGVAITDREGTIVWANAAVTALTGYPSDELVGRNFRLLKSGRHNETFYHDLWTTILSGQVWRGELLNRRKDQSQYTEEMTITPVRDHRGEISQFVAIKQDVTERRKAQEEIRMLNEELDQRVKTRTEELEAANREMEAFTYSVSHDLRAPLRHVHVFVDILMEDYGPSLDARARAHLERVREAATNMGHLVDGLLKLSRLGRQPLARRLTALGPLVLEAVEEVKLDVTEREIEWRIGLLPAIECDPNLVRQVFVNLLSNAVKYTERRQHAVIVVDQIVTNGRPVFLVRDNGVGFDMQYADKLFGVFQRLHRTEQYEGTGVGLATVQRIIHKHGGRVWAEAELNKGATFYFTLTDLAERRHGRRRSAVKGVTLRIESDPGKICRDAVTVNLSTRGARVRGNVALSPGQSVDLNICEDRPHFVPAHVVWVSEGQGEAGLRFLEPLDLAPRMLGANNVSGKTPVRA